MKILILKFDIEKPAGRNSAGILSQKSSGWQKFQHIVNVKVIPESEEDSNDKQKYYEKNKESKKKLSTH